MSDEEPKAKAGKAGGRARAEILSPEQRREIASKAARVRWSDPTAKLPKATHAGVLAVGDFRVPCYVLEDGRRLLSQSGMVATLSLSKGQVDRLGSFLGSNVLKPFVSEELSSGINAPARFKAPHGPAAYGYDATILVDICDAVLSARRAGALLDRQSHVADRCEMLVRALSKVGIIALVDEATGYQADRQRDELQRILEAYIVEELRSYLPRFPMEFFKQVHRIHGWEWHGDTRGPRYVGKLINRYIYDRLPPGVHDEIRRRNPATNGRRKRRHHQFLTEDTGVPHLDQQIRAVTVLMKAADNKMQFEKMLKRVFPAVGDQQELPDGGDGEGADE